MTFTVAIIGRPNVGKSTLFNRFVGKKLALVHDTPGLTRDWREADGHLLGLDFKVIDTAGLEETFDASIQGRMRRQTEQALEHADMALLVIDARTGITPMDRHFADWLRRQKMPAALIANKCESKTGIVGNILHFNIPVVIINAVSQHGDAKRTGSGSLLCSGSDNLLRPLMVNAFADGFFHKHPCSAGSAAEPPVGIAIHFNQPAALVNHHQQVTRRFKNTVPASQVTGIMKS